MTPSEAVAVGRHLHSVQQFAGDVTQFDVAPSGLAANEYKITTYGGTTGDTC